MARRNAEGLWVAYKEPLAEKTGFLAHPNKAEGRSSLRIALVEVEKLHFCMNGQL